MRMAARLQAMKHPNYLGTTRKSGKRSVWTGKVHLNDNVLHIPYTWKKPRLVFVNSMSDLFQPAVPFEYVDKVWRVMMEADAHNYQILTKRPDIMNEYLRSRGIRSPDHIWLGTSVESANVKSRIVELRNTPASIRFVSFEPLIGSTGKLSLRGIHWAIVGGESGPGARPMKEEWVEEIFNQCRDYNTEFFFKQWGGVNKKKTGREFKGKTWDNLPALA
jgi:protein gp37